MVPKRNNANENRIIIKRAAHSYISYAKLQRYFNNRFVFLHGTHFNIECDACWSPRPPARASSPLSLVNPRDFWWRQQNIEIKNTSLEPIPGCVTVEQSLLLSKSFIPLKMTTLSRPTRHISQETATGASSAHEPRAPPGGGWSGIPRRCDQT